MADVAVIGAGAWGTALATAADRAGSNVTLWAREAPVVKNINQLHENMTFLKGIRLRASIKATQELEDILDAEVIFIVSPSQYLRGTIAQLANMGLPKTTPLVLCSKGIEMSTLKMMNEVAEEITDNPIAVLSGPTFASEVALGLPASITLACKDKKLAMNVIAPCVMHENFKVFYTNDIIGAEIGGAVKNVIAIACGIAEGKRLGKNAAAALITRGLKEMKRLALAKGGKAETLMELCGVGDLILTCGSSESRNMSLGYLLGEGKSLEAIMESRVSVAEGVANAESVVALARQLEVSVPICEAVNKIVHGKADIHDTLQALIRES